MKLPVEIAEDYSSGFGDEAEQKQAHSRQYLRQNEVKKVGLFG